MTPEQLAKSGTEHGHQAAFFCWLQQTHPDIWDHAFAIPNGGSRGEDQRSRMIRGSNLKAEGVKRGVPDIMIAWPINPYHGLFIEMKKPVVGTVADKQSDWHARLERMCYKVVVAYSWHDAANLMYAYFGHNGSVKPCQST